MKKHPWIMYIVGAILVGALGWLSPHPSPLSVECLSRPVAACGLATDHFRDSPGGVLLLAARGALGGAGEATEEGHLVLPAGLAGDWFYRGGPLRPAGRPGAALPGRAANQPAHYFADSGLHGRTHVRPGRNGDDLFRRFAVGAGPRDAAPSRGPATRSAGRPGGHRGACHFRHQRARFRQSGCRPGGKEPGLVLARSRSFGGQQDSRFSRWPRFHRHLG